MNERMREPILITGAGTVSSAGLGLEALRERLEDGLPRLSEVPEIGEPRRASARMAAQLGEDPYSPWLSPREARRMSPASRMAVCTARMAVDAAGLEKADLEGRDSAVCVGTAFGSTTYTSALLEQVRQQGPPSISPLLFMETVANAHAGQEALAFGATGANITVSQRESSALLALARGAYLLQAGRSNFVLAGSVDEVSPVLHWMLDRCGALARPSASEDLELARVFDLDRNGFILAEGGTTFLLERASQARARGAQCLAEVRAWARANDPSAPVAGWGSGHAELSRRLVRRLNQLDVTPDSIDLVVSGANGNRRGDLLEARVLHDAFGGSIPPVVTPKAVTGEYGGGFLASALLALEPLDWAVPRGYRKFDPATGIRPHAGQSLGRPGRVLVTTLASGGTACWLVLDRVEGS